MKNTRLFWAACCAASITGAAAVNAQPAPALKINKGDHVTMIGNALPDVMQRFGWLETGLQARFPGYDLVVRNEGFAGDTVEGSIRTQGFGSQDDWLKFNKTNVVLAFYGYNESFDGPEGVSNFKKQLAGFIQHVQGQKYDGATAPRLVLFSPIAFENLHNPDLPDGVAINKNLALYTEAIADAAKAGGATFVDLFHPTLAAYVKASEPLTVNGFLINEHGGKVIAGLINRALFGGALTADSARLTKLHQAVLDKNFCFVERYRTVDGYNVYGGRSKLAYTGGITNYEVMQREMKVLDVMAENREKRVWAVAQGKDMKVDDSNTPPFIPVKTNRKGPGPNGTFIFLDPEKAISKMTVAKGMKVNLFASEKDYPELANPVQMYWDAKGRLWVACWPSYPHWKPKDELTDKIIILEDTDHDGKADKCTTFADHLNVVSGFIPYKDGAIVAQAPEIWFMEDTDGDGKADKTTRILEGIDSSDTHHTANSFVFGPGGAMFYQEGVFFRSQLESPYGLIRNTNAAVYRFEPRTYRIERYAAYNFANPHGHNFDYWGQDFVTDGTGNKNYWGQAFSGHIDYPAKHKGMHTFFKQPSRPSPGNAILSSRMFPKSWQGDYLDCNVIGFQGIFHFKFTDDGSGFGATREEDLIKSSDFNFRPTVVNVGPDGALYVADWQNPLIGHMQHHLRDPNRDHTHGRIYRITYEGGPLLTPPKIVGEPIEKLLNLLITVPELGTQNLIRQELGTRPDAEVLPVLDKWVAGLDKSAPNYQHNALEGLWIYQWHNQVNLPLLKQLLRSPDYRARAAATNVLCSMRDKVPNALDLLKVQVNDENARVRLEAVRACSFFRTSKAAEVALDALNHPQDYWLKYTMDETMRQLDKFK